MLMPRLSTEPRVCSRAARRWIVSTIGLAIVLGANAARAESVDRNPSETDGGFMARVLGPSAELAQKVIRSSELAGGKAALIAFVNTRDESADHSKGGDLLVGHLLIQTSPTRFEHVTFPSCDEEGGAPELLAVFFARTAEGRGRDLAVLCGWDSHGMCYGAEFYRLEETGPKMAVRSMTDLKKEFFSCDETDLSRTGMWTHGRRARFKTVSQVKALLAKKGIKQ